MYWRWNRIPELVDLPQDERKRLWDEARRDPFRATDILWLAAITGILVGSAIAFVMYVPKNLPSWIELPIILGEVFALNAIVQSLLILRYRPVVRRLRRLA